MDKTPLENWIIRKTGIAAACDKSDALRACQLHRLRETIGRAMDRSRFYGRLLRGLDPDTVKTMGDVARLPFTRADDIAVDPLSFLCVSPHEIARIVTLTTSGTTGPPKRIHFTEDDQELTVDFFHHGMTTLVGPSDRVMIFMPGDTPGSVGDLLVRGLSRFGCTGIVHGPIRDYNRARAALISEEITCVVGIPSQVLALGKMPGPQILGVRSVLLSADYVPRAAVEFLSHRWGARVFGHYGLTETGLGGGVECAALDGYHLREADLLFEVVDPERGLPVPDGQYGEVVFSTLTRRGMPLIRYRTGDRARFMTEPCSCGTFLRRLGPVAGRFAEPVRLKSGGFLSIGHLDEIVLADEHVADYAAHMDGTGGRDCLRLTVRAARAGFDPAALAARLHRALAHLSAPDGPLLDIREGPVGFFTSGTAKRRITDTRSEVETYENNS